MSFWRWEARLRQYNVERHNVVASALSIFVLKTPPGIFCIPLFVPRSGFSLQPEPLQVLREFRLLNIVGVEWDTSLDK